MPGEISFLAALLVGFLGSSHCLGMCGGIAGTLAVSTDRSAAAAGVQRIVYLLIYNLGRISSYTMAGFAVGFLGHVGFGLLPPDLTHGIAMWVTALFLVALGLYLGGWWSFLPWLEIQGNRLWRLIEPLGRHLLPVTNKPQAFTFGLIWGWLPCGLVYSVLAWAATTADPIRGALVMLGFGLGTLPTVFVMGLTGQTLQRLRQNSLFRQVAGVSLIVFAVAMLGMAASDKNGHAHHQHAQPDQSSFQGGPGFQTV